LFVTEFLDDGQFEFVAVKVCVKVEQVSFDAELRVGVLECWTMANVENSAKGSRIADFGFRISGFGFQRGVDGIYTGGRQGESGNVQVGGGKAELAAQAISADNGSRKRIAAAKHLAGGIEIACLNGFADTCAAHSFAIQRNGRQTMHGKFQFSSELSEQLDITTSFVTKNKLGANAQTLDSPKAAGQSPDERFTGLLAESLVEVNQEKRIGAKRFDSSQFLGKGIDQGRDSMRSNDDIRVAIEGEDDSGRFVLSGIADRLADDLLVAQVNAVEKADREANFCRIQFGCRLDNSHRCRRWPRYPLGNTKLQAPSSREAPSTKLQYPNMAIGV